MDGPSVRWKGGGLRFGRGFKGGQKGVSPSGAELVRRSVLLLNKAVPPPPHLSQHPRTEGGFRPKKIHWEYTTPHLALFLPRAMHLPIISYGSLTHHLPVFLFC